MDKSHAIFIIAKSKSQPYRTIAAAHLPREQPPHGVSLVSTCYRLLRVFSDETNRTAIQQEIALAADFIENAGADEVMTLYGLNAMDELINVPCPLPFITTCLIVGASYNPDLGSSAEVREKPFGLRYVYGLDSAKCGITVLDITDLSDVRYCFTDFASLWMSERLVALRTPLETWNTHSDNSDDVVTSNKAATDGLERYALVELAALVGWAKCQLQRTAADRDLDAEIAHGGMHTVPSLRSLCQAKLFQVLLSSDGPPDLTILNTPMLFRGFARDLQRYLTENVDALCKSPAAVEILKKAFAGEKHFNFTPFHNKLAADALIALASSEEFKDMKTVSLSGFDSWADIRTVVRIMEHLKLESLYLLSSPNRRTEDPSDLLSALATVSNQPFVREKLVLGSAFSRGLRNYDLFTQNLTAVNPAYWKNFPVVQLLARGPTDFRVGSLDDNPWLTDFFLGDALLNPVRFVTGLLNVIKSRFRNPFRVSLVDGALDVPLTFSCASSSLKALTATTEVSPLPARAFARGRRVQRRVFDFWGNTSIQDLDPEGGTAVLVPEGWTAVLVPEGWTAVLVHEATLNPKPLRQVTAKTRFKVALVRSCNHPIPLKDCTITPDKLEIVDLRAFLELTAPEHVEDLNDCLSELTAWAQTDAELVSNLPIDEVVATLQAFVDGRSGPI